MLIKTIWRYIKQNKWHLAYLLSTLSLACWEMQLERPPWFEKKKRQVTNRRIMKCIVNKNDDWTGNGAFMKLPIVKKNRWNERSMRKKRKLPRRNFLNEQRFGHTLLREQIKSRCWIPPSTWPHYPLFCSFGWYGWTTRKCFFLCLCILVHIINHISISVLRFSLFSTLPVGRDDRIWLLFVNILKTGLKLLTHCVYRVEGMVI